MQSNRVSLRLCYYTVEFEVLVLDLSISILCHFILKLDISEENVGLFIPL